MADNYGTAEGFRAYHTARGRSVVGYEDDDEVTANLLVASEYIDSMYRASFGGLKLGQRAQVREWPRTGAFDIYGYAIPSDIVPVEVDNATYEGALKLLQGTALSRDYTPPKYRRASVDGAVSVEYVVGSSAAEMQVQFPLIDQALSAIIARPGGTYSPLSGAIGRA